MSNSLLYIIGSANADPAIQARSYSGRGMYGKTCLGFSVASGVNLLGFAGSVLSGLSDQIYSGEGEDTEYDDDRYISCVREFSEMLQNARWDNLGLGTIIYFPDVDWKNSYDGDDSSSEEEDSDDEDGDEE